MAAGERSHPDIYLGFEESVIASDEDALVKERSIAENQPHEDVPSAAEFPRIQCAFGAIAHSLFRFEVEQAPRHRRRKVKADPF